MLVLVLKQQNGTDCGGCGEIDHRTGAALVVVVMARW